MPLFQLWFLFFYKTSLYAKFEKSHCKQGKPERKMITICNVYGLCMMLWWLNLMSYDKVNVFWSIYYALWIVDNCFLTFQLKFEKNFELVKYILNVYNIIQDILYTLNSPIRMDYSILTYRVGRYNLFGFYDSRMVKTKPTVLSKSRWGIHDQKVLLLEVAFLSCLKEWFPWIGTSKTVPSCSYYYAPNSSRIQ